jgi:hypothetical protein
VRHGLVWDHARVATDGPSSRDGEDERTPPPTGSIEPNSHHVRISLPATRFHQPCYSTRN